MQPYNHTRKLFLGQEVDLTALKYMLRSGTTFTAANTDVNDLNGTEVSGNGWTAGGEAFANVESAIFDTNQARLNADNIVKEATAGGIGPADSAVLVDSSTTPATLLGYDSFDPAKVADEGTEFQVRATDALARLLEAV